MTPSEQVHAAATRGLRALQLGINQTNLYDRIDFSDLRVYYNNMYQVAKLAMIVENRLMKLGVVLDEIEDTEEPDTLESLTKAFDDISGVSSLSRGTIPPTENKQPSRPARIFLRVGKPKSPDTLQLPEWLRGSSSSSLQSE